MSSNLGLLAALNMQTSASTGPKKLFSNKPVQLSSDIRVEGKNPESGFAASLRQQDLARREVFDPQYRKSLSYALDTSQPETQALKAGDQAEKSMALTRDEFMRLQAANGSASDPRLDAETERLAKFDAVKNVAGAENSARQTTLDDQMQQLGNLTSYGAATARQALGLQTGASSAYTARQQQLSQLEQSKKMMAAQATQANIGMGVSIATTVASIAAAAAIA